MNILFDLAIISVHSNPEWCKHFGMQLKQYFASPQCLSTPSFSLSPPSLRSIPTAESCSCSSVCPTCCLCGRLQCFNYLTKNRFRGFCHCFVISVATGPVGKLKVGNLETLPYHQLISKTNGKIILPW